MKNRLGMVLLRTRIGRTWWLPVLFLLATSVAIQAQDYTYKINSDKTITVTKYTGSGGEVIIPSTIDGHSVVIIGDRAFNDCYSLTSVMIPSSIISIGENVFYACRDLTSIMVDAQNSIYSSVDGVLFNKKQTTILAYPVGRAGSYTIPSSVTSIGKHAFSSAHVDNVTIPNSIVSIGDMAFYSSRLISITIPDSITSIGRWAFAYSSKLTNITIPNSVISIGERAFCYCTGLTSVTIPGSVTSIGIGRCQDTFSGCNGLTSITVNAQNSVFSSVDGVLFNKRQNTLIAYPIGRAGHYTIPGGVTSIGSAAFSNCKNLTSIIIPNSVISIGDIAFYQCAGLSGVYFQGNPPSLASSLVFKDADNTIIYYLDGTTGWKPTFGGRPTELWITSASIAPVIPSNTSQPQAKIEMPISSRVAVSAERGRPVSSTNFDTKSMSLVIPVKSDKSDLEKSSQDSSDYKLLVGNWTVGEGDLSEARTFEFKNNKTVIFTFFSRTTDGGSGKHSSEWKAKIKKDKIIIEPEGRKGWGYQEWYEITIPFDPNNLLATRYYKQKGSSGNTTYQLYKRAEAGRELAVNAETKRIKNSPQEVGKVIDNSAIQGTDSDSDKNATEQERKLVALTKPYPSSYRGAPTDRISVQYAVIELGKQAGFQYEWKESYKNTDPICRQWVYPEIKNEPFRSAMRKILSPVGLTYELCGNTIVLKRK